MTRSIAVGWVAGLALGLIAAPLGAQTTVQAAVIIQSGPGDGHVADRAARVIGPEREVIVVKRVQARRGWWKKHKYRMVTVYYDGRRYYLRRFDRPHLRRVIVYERGGRYYIDEDHWKRKHRHHDRHDDQDQDDD